MVLVGKVNKDIVLRLGRHGQPAVGLCGDDGLLFRVARQAAPSGQRHRVRRAHRARRRRRPQPRRRGLHPGRGQSVGADREGNSYNVNADEAAGAVAGALGAYKVHLPHRRRGLARRPVRRGERRVRGDRGGGARRRSTASRAGCAPSSRRASTRSQAGVTYAHIVDGRVPHSLLLELFTDAGIGTKIAARDPVRAPSARARPRRADLRPAARWSSSAGRARGCGTTRATSTSTSCPASRSPASATATRGWSRRSASRRAGSPTPPTSSTPSRRCASPRGCRSARWAGKVFFANSGAEAIEAAIKLARRARPQGDDRRVRGRVPRAHLRRALGDAAGVQAGAVRAARSRIRGRAQGRRGPARGGDGQDRGGAGRARTGRDGRVAAARRAARGGARGLRPGGRGADLRRDPVAGWGGPGPCGPTSRPRWCPTR